MPFETATQETNEATTPRAGLSSGVPDEARILILGDDEPDIERLKTVFREADFSAETATSITAGCEAAKSGRFQVVVSMPLLSDGSWRRLIDIANRHDLGFEDVLLARTFDLSQKNDLKAQIAAIRDRKSTRLNSSHSSMSHTFFCLYNNT